ncbi:MAG: hypothetical protein PVI40_05040 [Chlamydiota bacterium]|jgi:hypothetical protein
MSISKYVLVSIANIFAFADPSSTAADIPSQHVEGSVSDKEQVMQKKENASSGFDFEDEQIVDEEENDAVGNFKGKKNLLKVKKKVDKFKKQHRKRTEKFVNGMKKFIKKGMNIGKKSK